MKPILNEKLRTKTQTIESFTWTVSWSRLSTHWCQIRASVEFSWIVLSWMDVFDIDPHYFHWLLLSLKTCAAFITVLEQKWKRNPPASVWRVWQIPHRTVVSIICFVLYKDWTLKTSELDYKISDCKVKELFCANYSVFIFNSILFKCLGVGFFWNILCFFDKKNTVNMIILWNIITI